MVLVIMVTEGLMVVVEERIMVVVMLVEAVDYQEMVLLKDSPSVVPHLSMEVLVAVLVVASVDSVVEVIRTTRATPVVEEVILVVVLVNPSSLPPVVVVVRMLYQQ